MSIICQVTYTILIVEHLRSPHPSVSTIQSKKALPFAKNIVVCVDCSLLLSFPDTMKINNMPL